MSEEVRKKRSKLCYADKEAAVRKYLDNKATAKEIALEYNIVESTLYKWIKKYHNGELNPVKEITADTDDKTTIRILKKENAKLREDI